MSAFDPRFKTLKNVCSKDERDGAWDAIAEEAMSRQSQDEINNTTTRIVEPPTKKRRILGAQFNTSSSSEDGDTVSDVKQDIIDEIARYKKEPKMSKDGNPLEFWKKNKKKFPHLVNLAKKYLCVVATSTTAERIFSTLGLLLTKRRLSLTGDNINKIMFLSDKLFL